MKPLDKYQFNKKLKELGKLSWDLLVLFSKLSIGVFGIISIILLWVLLGTYIYQETGVNLSTEINPAIKVLLITSFVVLIDWVLKLKK